MEMFDGLTGTEDGWLRELVVAVESRRCNPIANRIKECQVDKLEKVDDVQDIWPHGKGFAVASKDPIRASPLDCKMR